VGTVQHCLGAVMIDFQFSKGGRRGGAEHNSFLIECYVRHVGRGLVIEQIDLNNVMLYRQPQRHCKNAVITQVLVTPFGFTKTCFVLVLQGSSQNLSTKTFCFDFFLNHEPKHQRKLSSPIRDENSQNIAYRYKTYIRRNQKKRKKSFGRLQGTA
jgi:hypothetical protein